MGRIEFFTSPDGMVNILSEHGSERYTQQHTEVTDMVIEMLSTYFTEALDRLKSIYAKSAPNRQYFRYLIANRFIRCNFGELDTQAFDMEDASSFHMEQVKCPLRGECPNEGCICSPRLNRLLSPREEQVIRCLADGMTRAQTADSLCIATNTVNRHIDNIKKRLSLPSTQAAISLLLRLYKK